MRSTLMSVLYGRLSSDSMLTLSSLSSSALARTLLPFSPPLISSVPNRSLESYRYELVMGSIMDDLLSIMRPNKTAFGDFSGVVAFSVSLFTLPKCDFFGPVGLGLKGSVVY